MDQQVQVYGTTRHDMNGKHGVATDFHPALTTDGAVVPEQSRYTVLLDSGEQFKISPSKLLRAERGGAAGGARPKAKSKAKKGQGKGN